MGSAIAGPGSMGKVGFFWVVPGRSGRDIALGEALELDQAEPYGDTLTHAKGHYTFWQEMKKRGPAWLRARQVSGSILSDEYEDWPRGRVVYLVREQRFDVFAHPSLFEPEPLALVLAMFDLNNKQTRLRTDPHYGLLANNFRDRRNV